VQSLNPSSVDNLTAPQAARAIELIKRIREIEQAQKTVYGFYRPNGTYGGELVSCLQEVDGRYVEVDAEPTVALAEKMKPLLVTKKRFKGAFGGRGSTKSIGAGSIFSAQAKDYGTKTLCLREMQNTIEDSVHALLADQIRSHYWTNFEVTDKAIRLNGDDVFKFRGLARNTDGVKSMFGFKAAWVEEAQALSTHSIETLTPTIREADSEIWFTFNPQSSADPMSQRFLKPFYSQLLEHGIYEDDLHLFVWMNYTDNPWHSELEPERAFDEQNMSTTAYRNKWLGFYNDEVANSIIPVDWFDAAIDAHIKLGWKPTGARIAAYDPSDLGPDDKGYAQRHGSLVEAVCSSAIGDSNEGTDWALGKAINARVDHFTWDCDGLGVALKRQVDAALQGKSIQYTMFRGSESPEHPEQEYIEAKAFDAGRRKSNKDTFANKRAQYYIRLADRFYATYRAVVRGEYVNPDDMISLSSEIECMEALRAEVCRIPRKPNNNGKIQIVSKVDLAKKPYEMKSPNLADSLMMLMLQPETETAPVHIDFKGWG